MQRLVFDKFLNTVIWANQHEIKNKLRYKKINAKTLNKLMIENYKLIIKIIKSNGKNKLYHLSTVPLTTIRDTSHEGTTYVGKTNLYYNPVGLWISCDDAYFKSADSSGLHYSYVYEIICNKSILTINGLDEFENFIMKFRYSNSKIKITDVLNWKKIKKIYDGIVICPFLGNELFKNSKSLLNIYKNENIICDEMTKLYEDKWKSNLLFLSEWYRYWGEASGVLWRSSAIKNIILIKKTDTFDILKN